MSPGPFFAAALLGTAAFLLSRASGQASLSDFLFCLGSGTLVVGLTGLLQNLHAFDSFRWGMRFWKRLWRGEARPGREETEDYAEYRAGRRYREDAPWLLLLSFLLMALSAWAAR